MKRICLWSCPRNVSTAFMYSFAQRPDTVVVDEPLYAAYLANTEVSHPGNEDVLNSQSHDAETVFNEVIYGSYDSPVLFIKNMAHHLPTALEAQLEGLINIFLIREPDQMLTSLVNQIPDPILRDTGYGHQHRLFDQLRAKGHKAIVIDSKELLSDPEGVLQQLCDAIGLDFDRKMLSWEAGPIPEDGIWAPHWYDNVHRSTGFGTYRRKEQTVTDNLKPLLKECQAHYDALLPFALKARTTSIH